MANVIERFVINASIGMRIELLEGNAISITRRGETVYLQCYATKEACKSAWHAMTIHY